jgi:hypothetical protein
LRAGAAGLTRWASLPWVARAQHKRNRRPSMGVEGDRRPGDAVGRFDRARNWRPTLVCARALQCNHLAISREPSQAARSAAPDRQTGRSARAISERSGKAAPGAASLAAHSPPRRRPFIDCSIGMDMRLLQTCAQKLRPHQRHLLKMVRGYRGVTSIRQSWPAQRGGPGPSHLCSPAALDDGAGAQPAAGAAEATGQGFPRFYKRAPIAKGRKRKSRPKAALPVSWTCQPAQNFTRAPVMTMSMSFRPAGTAGSFASK